MSDLVATIFRLTNARFSIAPKVDFEYQESDTGVQWHVVAGGSRAYLMRLGANLATRSPTNIGEQSADSHFMMDRLQSCLLLGGKGLFQKEVVGRIFLESVHHDVSWFTQLDFPATPVDEASAEVYDWLEALTRHTILRRAAADARAALFNPHEAGLFVYRGLEWLVVGEGRTWDDLAVDIGVSSGDMKRFKKLANVDFGVRHASRSGKKLRASVDNYGTWVCALVDAINATRSRLESGYSVATPETVARVVSAAIPTEPYP